MSEQPEALRLAGWLQANYEADGVDEALIIEQERAAFEAWAASIGLKVTGWHAESLAVLCAESAFKAGYQAAQSALRRQDYRDAELPAISAFTAEQQPAAVETARRRRSLRASSAASRKTPIWSARSMF